MTTRYIENLDEIKAKLNPEDVLEYLQPGRKKRSGRELRSPCPVHGGDGPENFSLNLDNHKWTCFSHGCTGTNLLDLCAQSKNIPINVAAEELAARFGITVRYKESGKRSQNASYTSEDVLRCWSEADQQGQDTYFSRKKLTPPPIAKFGKNPAGYHSTLIAYKNIDGELKLVLSLGGKKYEYKAGETKGTFALLGELSPEGSFYVGEGVATVQTGWEAAQRKIPAVSCRSWSNILPVVAAIKGKYPNSKPIILIDCDEGRKGLQAAQMVAKAFPDATFRKPSFDGFSYPGNEKPADFNDILSICSQSLDEVQRQLQIEYKLPMSTDATKENQPSPTHVEGSNFYEKLGVIIKDPKFSLQLKERDYDVFEQEHKRLFSSGGLVTGYKELDEQLYFAKGDFVVVQAMSNHGKSTFMLQLAYRFLTEEANRNKDPMCIFITYESMPIRIEEKLVNIIGRSCENDTPIKYSIRNDEKYLYPTTGDFKITKATFNNIQKHNRMHILKSTPLEKLEHLINLYKAEYPEKTLVLFLDYFQIIDTAINSDGWERIKAMAYKLESLAIEKEVIIISACQVNENRQTREGRDIYNAATTILDLFNHSHVALKSNKDLAKDYKPSVKGKNVCTLSAVKQKHGSSFALPDYLLFDGYGFEANTKESNMNSSQASAIEEPVGNLSKAPERKRR